MKFGMNLLCDKYFSIILTVWGYILSNLFYLKVEHPNNFFQGQEQPSCFLVNVGQGQLL
jgi:hypothetical protein